MAARESHRVKDADKKRVLDEAARNRRARKALEALEQDNFHDDPHADLVMSKKVPKFHDSLEQSRSQRAISKQNKRKATDYIKAKYRKSFAQLLEDEEKALSGGRNGGGGGGATNQDDDSPSNGSSEHRNGGSGGATTKAVRATYANAQASPSAFPERHFCAVCGFPSSYTCTSCGTRYCCIRCLGTHRDTRCLKWTA